MRRAISTIGCLAATTLITAGLTAPAAPATQPSLAAASAAAAATAGDIRWRECDDPFLQEFGAECGYVTVPLDHSNPRGRTIKLAVSRVLHTSPDEDYQGVMLTNPGGPGGSGLFLAVFGAFMPNGSGSTYDWIGFDPRGVGSSKPALSCKPHYFHKDRPPYTPMNDRILDRWLARAESYADACQEAAPGLLPHMKTTDSARDLNRIRAALGADKINYYGYSYGTYLGQVYATLFPHRVRRMVLDSNVDPSRVWYEFNLQQNIAFERVAQKWFAWIARHHRVYRLGTTAYAVEERYYRTQARLRDRPAKGVVGPSEWTDAFSFAAYNTSTWPHLADVFSGWVHDREAEPLIDAYRSYGTPGDDNLFAVYNAVECTDAPWPRDWKTWDRDNWAISQFAPFFTWANAWFNAACRVWPVKPGRPTDVDGHGVRALLIGETLDGATPFSGSLEVRSRFPRSSLVGARGGVTHAATPFQSTRCTNSRLAAYLETGELPPRRPGRRADVLCKPQPLPEPESSQRSARPVERLLRTVTIGP